MSEPLHPLLRFGLVYQAERGAIQRSLRERRRRALERPAARAELDRALGELDDADTAGTDTEDWLTVLTTLAILNDDDGELDHDTLREQLRHQLAATDTGNLAGRVALLNISDADLEAMVDAIRSDL